MIGLTNALMKRLEGQSKSGFGYATAKAPMGQRITLAFGVLMERYYITSGA